MNRKSFELKFCFLFVSIAFAFFLGLPLANLAYKSLQTGSGTGLGNYAAILTDDAFLTAFRNSFAISALEAAITTAAAFILAYGLHLTRIPGKIKEGLQLVIMMPMFLPSITYLMLVPAKTSSRSSATDLPSASTLTVRRTSTLFLLYTNKYSV